jgi:tetratricopeptide (TPR) repeat protein/predicted Ser/Thr protein kinase
MSALSSNSTAGTRDAAAPQPSATLSQLPPDRTASLGAQGGENQTRSFEGPDSPSTFPTPDDRYQLLAFLARGGMGEVWTARDRVLNRDVALKLLRDDLKDRTPSASRFVEEARITGKLQHPGIPPVHDLGTLRDGRPFIAMKLIRGRTLADVLAQDRPPLADLLRTFEDVCQAVAYAHDRRVIHRDLKPGNVMVGAFDEVQVMDWGLAKVLGETLPPPDSHPPGQAATTPPVSVIESDRDPSSHTRAGSLLGTPAYMPPEQAKGDIDRTDTRSDVFALGAVLCELLTGRPAYWAATPQEVLALAITAQLGPAFERLDGAGVDAELVALAKRCLQADPASRPVDAKQVAAAVASFRAGVEGRLREAERERAAAEARLVEQRKRRRVQLALATAAVVIVAGAAGAAWWADKQATDRELVRQAARAELDRLEDRRAADAKQQQLEAESRAARNAQAVEYLLDEVNAALATDDANKAAVLVGLIEERLAEGSVGEPAVRVARAIADLRMLRGLDAADDQMWSAEDFKLRARRSTEAWAAAFRGYGIDLKRTPIEDATRVVNMSVLRERLLLALDLWLLNGTEADRPPELRRLLQCADPDPYRDRFRTAVFRSDFTWRLSLLEDPEAFHQPARFTAVIGQAFQFDPGARERVLRPALEANPGNYSLILTMLVILEGQTSYRPDTATQKLRWAQAAVSVRPASKHAWRCLGRAQWDAGRVDDAVRCFRKAVRLDPRDYNSWTQLSAVLLRTTDPEAALAAAERALELNPEYSHGHYQRGSVLDRMGRLDDAAAAFTRAIEIEAGERAEYARSYNSRGTTRMRLGDFVGAIVDFKEALRVAPDDRQADANLSRAIRLRRSAIEPETAPPPREVPP